MDGLKYGIIGGGNLAWHLAKMLNKNSLRLSGIYVRSPKARLDFNFISDNQFVEDIPQLVQNSDILFFCVPDKSLSVLLDEFSWQNKLLVHTAGSVDINVFVSKSVNYGVFYPLQTFSKFREIEYAKIPFFIEADKQTNAEVLQNIALEISNKVMLLNSEKRRQMHLAAVFVNNFANRMWSIGQELCEEQNIPFHYLDALIQETYAKALENNPLNSQTGPAVRNDKLTINMHLDMLKNKALLKKIYSFVSQSIIQTKNKA